MNRKTWCTCDHLLAQAAALRNSCCQIVPAPAVQVVITQWFETSPSIMLVWRVGRCYDTSTPKLLTEGIDSVILIMLFTILHSLLSSTFGIIQLLWSIILIVPSFGWCGGDLFRTQLHPDEWQRQSIGSQDAYVAALYREMNLLINFVLFN